MSDPLSNPRIVRTWEGLDLDFRLVYTGSHYEMQEGKNNESWECVSQENAFGLLACCSDPLDNPDIKEVIGLK